MSKRAVMVAILLASIAIALTFAAYTSYTEEDALITLRMSRNFARGNGFVYNQGEQVLGTTTPLFGLVVGLLALMFGDCLIIAKALGIIAFGVTAVFAYRMWDDCKRCGLILSLLVATFPGFLVLAVGGMETMSVVATGVLTAYLCKRGRLISAGVAAAVLLMLRLDMAPFVVLCGLWLWIDRREFPKAMAVTTGVIMVVWLTGLTLYFGTFMPQSAIAKTALGQQYVTGGYTLLRYIKAYLPSFGQSGANILYTVLICVLALSGVFRSVQRRNWWTLFWLVFFIEEALRFSVLHVIPSHWHRGPASFAFLVLVAQGLYAWASVLGDLMRRKRWLLRSRAIVLSAGVTIGLFLLLYNAWGTAWYYRYWQSLYDHSYISIASFLQTNAGETDRVALEPIGYIGYYSDRYIICLVGLVTPVSTRLWTESPDGWSVRFFREIEPEFIVYRTLWLQCNADMIVQGQLFESEEERQWLMEKYQPVARYVLDAPPHLAWWLSDLVILARDDRASTLQTLVGGWAGLELGSFHAMVNPLNTVFQQDSR
jgi:hypothetical protein